MKFSIIVSNFNYGRYLNACLDSALGQTYPNYEVIVVDDGSSDCSMSVIKSYGTQITAVFKSNGGQGSAYNVGWKISTGDAVIFLDSDDVLKSTALEVICRNWRNEYSKIHWPLEIIDDKGNSLDGSLPSSLHEGDLRSTVEKFGIYASSPGSGNVYSRAYLNEVLPLKEDNWRIASDAYLIGLAPFYGDIGMLSLELGFYRLQRNSGVDGGEFSLNHSPGNPYKAVARTLLSRRLIWNELLRRNFVVSKSPQFEMTPSDAKVRIISYRFFGEHHPVKSDSAWGLALAATRATFSWEGYSASTRLLLCIWFFTVLFLPRPLGKQPAIWLSNPRSLPRIVRAAKKFLLR